MNLLGWELRKIFHPAILAALLLLGVVYYWLFPKFYMDYFSNGSDIEAQYALACQWVEEYGPTLEPEERAETDSQLQEEIAAFDRQIASIPEAAASGWEDYAAFCAFREDYYQDALQQDSEADMDTEALLWRVYSGTNWFRIQAITRYQEYYDGLPALRRQTLTRPAQDWRDFTPAMIRREQTLAADMSPSYAPLLEGMLSSTREYARDLAVWCVLSVVILLCPTLVRDRLRRTRALQWSSRRGRGVLSIQMGAAFFSALALTLCNLLLYAVPFLNQGVLQFRACRMEAILQESTFWFGWSYGAYLLALAGLILALSLAAAGLSLFLSWHSGNFISLLLKALPLFVALGAVLGSWLLDMPFSFRRLGQSGPWLPRGIEGTAAAVLLISSLLLCILCFLRQKRQELA